MTPDGFEDLLDRCGGDPAAWPPGARAAAERLLATSHEARDALARQREVDAWLAAPGSAPAVGRDFASEATRERQARPEPPAAVALRRWSGAAAIGLVALGLGVAAGASHAALEEPAQALAAALAAPGETADVG